MNTKGYNKNTKKNTLPGKRDLIVASKILS